MREYNKLALFDFDGTLTRKDTMFEFIAFARGHRRLWWSLLILSPLLVLTKLGHYSPEAAKKRLLRFHFSGWTAERLQKLGETFCHEHLPRLFREDALEKLNFHRSRGHVVYVVTASLELWVSPWLRLQGIPGICTKVDWVDGKFTGEFEGANCNGPEKARRIRDCIDLISFDRIYAYGDSKGDREMFALAHRSFFRKFK
jgi:phosphatidylglycerophosphatase C